jgi:hypothetical protein
MEYNFNPSFWRSFFGFDFLNNNNRFIDQWRHLSAGYQNRIYGQKTAVWIDTTDAYKHYIEIPELRAVVDRRASMMSSNIPCLYDKDGRRVENHWLLDLIKKPNPTQSWSDVIYCLSVNDALWSSSFAYCPERSFQIRNLIVPLPSDKIKIQLTGRKLKQMESGGLIEYYEFCPGDDEERIDIEDMIYLATTDGINIINPSSRIESLKYPLSNIRAQYHKRNVLLENIGAIGILSAQNNEMGGAIPMDPEEKKEIQQDWFRRSKDELIITESDVRWNPMSYPTKDLMLFEELNSDKMALIDAFGLNVYLFSQEKGATFSNVRDGVRMAYTDTIIPETQQMYDAIMHQIGLSDEYRLIADFSHIPVLQTDEMASAQTMNTKADAINKIIAAGVPLSVEEIRDLMGITSEDF